MADRRDNRPGSGSGKGPGGKRGPGPGPGQGRGQAGRPMPIELAARSTRNALRRHAESVRSDESRLACRSVLIAMLSATRATSSPGELLAVVEQSLHVMEGSHPDFSQLPVALRAVVQYSIERPGVARDVVEMLRLGLRFGYVLAADHIPRQARDDGRFRAEALAEALGEVAREYLNDEAFQRAARSD